MYYTHTCMLKGGLVVRLFSFCLRLSGWFIMVLVTTQLLLCLVRPVVHDEIDG